MFKKLAALVLIILKEDFCLFWKMLAFSEIMRLSTSKKEY
jgi:hypothetical protein